jgi:hypothetical protein
LEATYGDLTDIGGIQFKPNYPLVLTGKLEFLRLRKIICRLAPYNPFMCVQGDYFLYGLKGIDISSEWKSNQNYGNFWIEFSTAAFFVNGSSKFDCSEEQMTNDANKNITYSFFKSFKSIRFGHYVAYENKPICPYWFSNTDHLKSLEIDSLADSFLVQNQFNFKKVNSSTSINSELQSFSLYGYNYKLDESLVHPLVFEKVQTIKIEGTIASIATDLFKPFIKLGEIYISVYCLSNFFHKVGLGWTSYSKNRLITTTLAFFEFEEVIPEWLRPGGFYTYPDKDMCLFAPIPLQNSLVILESNLTVCTDTVALLTQNYLANFKFLDDYARQVLKACLKSNYKNLTFFEIKLKQCAILNSSSSQYNSIQRGKGKEHAIFLEVYDMINIFLFMNDLMEYILIPFACIIGLLLNLRVIYVVHKNKKVELKEDFYKYMSLNSVFNCLFCMVYVFYPINFCQMQQTGFFCSTIYKTQAAQIFKIVFIGYFGEVLKMCSNISFIFITINRYMLIGKNHNMTLKKLSKLNFKLVVFLTAIFSLLINIGHVFQYRINWGLSYLLLKTDTSYFYPMVVIQNYFFNMYAIVYFVIDFAVFLTINTLVEFSLLRNLRKEIAEKRNKLATEISESHNNNTSFLTAINKVNAGKQKKIDQDKRKETRATVMVIINSGLNFFLRFPEIMVFIASNSDLLSSLLNLSENVNSSSIIYGGITMSSKNKNNL